MEVHCPQLSRGCLDEHLLRDMPFINFLSNDDFFRQRMFALRWETLERRPKRAFPS